MKHSYLLALSVPALLALALPADRVAFSPREGTRLTKTYTLEVETALDDLEVWVNGSETETPEIQNETVLAMSITVTDHYAKIAEGRPLRLERTFDGISGELTTSIENPMTGAMDLESTATSELEGTTVVFLWNEEDEEYEIAFAEDDADEDEDLLEGLDADMDLRAFLPGRGVSEGDSWEVENSALVALMAPGGDLHIAPDEEMASMGMGNQFDFAKQIGEVEGTITATYGGTRNVEGRQVGVIALTIETESSNDITDMMVEAAEAASAQSGMEQDFESADVQAEYDLEGELLWDIEGGHLVSLEIEGDTESVLDFAVTIRAMGEEIETEQAMYLSGEMRITIEVTRE